MKNLHGIKIGKEVYITMMAGIIFTTVFGILGVVGWSVIINFVKSFT